MMQTSSKEVMRTDELIRGLSGQAGRKAPAAVSPDRALGLSLVLSLLIALLVIIGIPGLRPGLPEWLMTWSFQFKVATMTLFAGGGAILVRAAGIPGMTLKPLLAVLPGVLLLFIGILFDRSGFPLLGARQMSVPLCVGAIIMASLPGLALIMAGLRRGIPTRLTAAGATAGFLSGSIGALAYTIACVNDGAMFVAIWYMVAIFITTAIGAVAGRYVLAW
ncbi:DUF1109 domain-containing protein [Chromatiaceae bacterium AAb-1]|nr:DUF1109 domain-containing protein [Chromatiaceae bacterium AAb-1]